MKKLMIVRTPYQLIVALYLVNQYCSREDQVDLIVTDNFNNYDVVVDRLKELKIFNNVKIMTLKMSILKKIFSLTTFKSVKSLEIEENYDELYFWNYDSFSLNLISYLFFKNKYLKVFIFEEGCISYFPLDEIYPQKKVNKLINFRNKLLKIKTINFDNIDGYFFFDPKLSIFDTPVKKYSLDRNDNKKIKEDIKAIFNVKKEIIENYDKKIIIFEEAMFFENNDFDYEKTILDIVDKVGKDNVIIKLHPRTKENRFAKYGIKTLGADGIPWEALTLYGNFSDKIFIAISSGSIVNYRLSFGKNMRGILLFKIIRPQMNYLDDKYDKFWYNIKSTYPEKGLYIPNDEKELNNLLNSISKEGNEE